MTESALDSFIQIVNKGKDLVHRSLQDEGPPNLFTVKHGSGMNGRLSKAANRANFLMSCSSAVRITPFLPGSLTLLLTWLWIPTDMHTCQMTQAGKWSRIEPYQNVEGFLVFVFVFFFSVTFCISTPKVLNFHFNYFYLCRYALTHCGVALSKIENDSDKLYNPGGDDLELFSWYYVKSLQ